MENKNRPQTNVNYASQNRSESKVAPSQSDRKTERSEFDRSNPERSGAERTADRSQSSQKNSDQSRR